MLATTARARTATYARSRRAPLLLYTRTPVLRRQSQRRTPPHTIHAQGHDETATPVSQSAHSEAIATTATSSVNTASKAGTAPRTYSPYLLTPTPPVTKCRACHQKSTRLIPSPAPATRMARRYYTTPTIAPLLAVLGPLLAPRATATVHPPFLSVLTLPATRSNTQVEKHLQEHLKAPVGSQNQAATRSTLNHDGDTIDCRAGKQSAL